MYYRIHYAFCFGYGRKNTFIDLNKSEFKKGFYEYSIAATNKNRAKRSVKAGICWASRRMEMLRKHRMFNHYWGGGGLNLQWVL